MGPAWETWTSGFAVPAPALSFSVLVWTLYAFALRCFLPLASWGSSLWNDCSRYSVPKGHLLSGNSRFWVNAGQGSWPQHCYVWGQMLFHCEVFSHQMPVASPSPTTKNVSDIARYPLVAGLALPMENPILSRLWPGTTLKWWCWLLAQLQASRGRDGAGPSCREVASPFCPFPASVCALG